MISKNQAGLLALLIGMPEEEAVASIKQAGMRARVVAKDGEHFVVTMDYRTDRINLNINEGKVTRADIG